MSMSDPIADMLTRIRNVNMIQRKKVQIPFSKIKENIAKILYKEGFISDYEIVEEGGRSYLECTIKYGEGGEKVIRRIQRVSKPGRRIYMNVNQIRPVLKGTGIGIYSTSKGVLTDKQCREQNVGGEYICNIW